ncbi:MAG: hypothetical protein WDA17_00595 [Sphaerochaetaceae bacterium]
MGDFLSGIQNELFRHITKEIEDNSFSHSSLFSGNRYSGRMSMALESVRLLSCSGDSSFNCICPYCLAFDKLKVDNLLIVGNRNHYSRIDALLENYKVLGTLKAKENLFKTIRIMLLNYRNPLYDPSNTKSNAIFSLSAALDETLDFLETEDDVEKVVNQLENSLYQMRSLVKNSSSLTINQVRLIQRWVTQTTFKNQNRVVIMEGIEECGDSALNSLLKLFEEPPKNTYIIVIAQFGNRLPATLLSRLRSYRFNELSVEEKNRLLSEKFFVEGSFYNSLEEFFLDRAKIPYRQINENANTFIKSIITKKNLDRKALEQLSLNLDDEEQLEYFFKKSEDSLYNFYYNNKISPTKVSSIGSIIKEGLQKALTFNQNGRILVETIYYRLLDM